MENSYGFLDTNVILLCIAIGLIIVIGLIVLKQKPRIIIIKENIISESDDEITIKELKCIIYDLKSEIQKLQEKNGNYLKVYKEDKAVIDSLTDEVRNLKIEINNEKLKTIFKKQNTYPTYA